MNYDYFIRGIRIPLSHQRLHIVISAFDSIDQECRGVLDASQIINTYEPSNHPDVLLGLNTPEGLLKEWLTTFDVGRSIDGRVTKEEFVDYYTNVGTTIGSEEYFELLVVNAWQSPRPSLQQNEDKVEESEIDYSQSDVYEPDDASNLVADEDNILSPDHQSYSPNSSQNTDGFQSQYEAPMSASMQNWTASNNNVHGLKSQIGEKKSEKGGSNRHYPQKRSQIHF
jgi:hypothetical protein